MKGCRISELTNEINSTVTADQCGAPNREMSSVVANAGNCRPMTAVDPSKANLEGVVKMIEPRLRNDRQTRATFDPHSRIVALMIHQGSPYVIVIMGAKRFSKSGGAFWSTHANEGMSMFDKQQTR